MEQEKKHIFTVKAEICLGFHCFGGSVTDTGSAPLELGDEELKTLIDFINHSDTVDVEEMGLEEKLPNIYGKLDDAYSEAARLAEEDHWLEAGWHNRDVFDPLDYLEFGEKELGYKFEYDESEFMDEDGKIDEDELEDAKMEDFPIWLTNYKDSLKGEERRKFMRQFIEVDPLGVEYEVKIPEEILDMCDRRKEISSDNAG